jgi:hypothetical protein
LGYIRERKRKKRTEETKEENHYMAWFASVTGNQREALEFQAKGGANNACFP